MSKFEINNMNLITTSNFVLNKNTDCTICHNLNTFSIYADKNITNIEHLVGTCGHTFHKECLTHGYMQKNVQYVQKCNFYKYVSFTNK